MIRGREYRSVNITRFFMKLVGLWRVETPREQLLLRIAFVYAMSAIIIAILIEGVDLYCCRNDFFAATANLCISLLLVLVLVRLSCFMFYYDELMELIRFAETNFWGVTYDESDSQILAEYDQLGMKMTYTFTFIVYLATFSYIFMPLLEMRENNGTEKVLPFKLWIDLPYHSPYYEVTYVTESLSAVHSGTCMFCFDNFVTTFAFAAAAQLKIVAHKVECIVERCIEDTINVKRKHSSRTEADTGLMFKKLQNYVRQHLTIIHYVQNMQDIFSYALLGQLLLSSMIICIGGFQLLAVDEFIWRCIFSIHFVGGIVQLLIYTWTCNDIIVQSSAICDAAYNSKWYLLPDTGSGGAVKRGLIMIMIRARRPCAMSAGHFAVMSLDTFTAILSTAMSYFTLLRQMSEEI